MSGGIDVLADDINRVSSMGIVDGVLWAAQINLGKPGGIDSTLAAILLD